MGKIKDWFDVTTVNIGGHTVATLSSDDAKLDNAVDDLAAAVPFYYASEKRIASLLERLGKTAAADYIRNKLPTGTKIRSGDLGEILASRYVSELTEFDVGIIKLRWKDHREMAMRGDDLIGLQPVDGPEKIRFLKGEVKSRANLTTTAVAEARDGLNTFQQKPSPHALEFIADRLHEEGDDDIGDLVDGALLNDGIDLKQVSHLLFTFSGNSPSKFLANNVTAYSGKVNQRAVGLRIVGHQDFIKRVFVKAQNDADGK